MVWCQCAGRTVEASAHWHLAWPHPNLCRLRVGARESEPVHAPDLPVSRSEGAGARDGRPH